MCSSSLCLLARYRVMLYSPRINMFNWTLRYFVEKPKSVIQPHYVNWDPGMSVEMVQKLTSKRLLNVTANQRNRDMQRGSGSLVRCMLEELV